MPELMIINPTKKRKVAKNRSTEESKKGRSKVAKRRKTRKKTVSNAGRRRSVPVRVTNPKRRKRRRSVPVRVINKGSRRRRRSNPSGINVNLPVLGQINVVDVGGGTLGSILAKMIPAYAAAQFGIPVAGVAKYPVQLGAGLLVSWLAANVLKQKGIAKYTALFTLNNVLTELATDYIVTPAGMGGLMGYPYSVLDAPRGLSGKVQTGDNPTVLYQAPETSRDVVVNDVPIRFATRY